MNDYIGFVPIGNITLYDSEGREWRAHNVMASGGLDAIRQYLAASSAALAPNPPLYVVYGSGTAPVGRFMSTVPGETFRAPIVQRDIGSGAASAIYHWFLQDTDNANQVVGCYGLVGGNATLAANTGIVFAIANEPTPFSKVSTQTLSGDWEITVSGLVS